MTKLREFGDLALDYSDIVDFVVVYIEEAHPEDGWSFKVSMNHRTILFVAFVQRKLVRSKSRQVK